MLKLISSSRIRGFIMGIKYLNDLGILLSGILAVALPVSNLAAKEIAIYRWVDVNNVVHFSQNLPKTDNYTQLSTVSSFKALSKEARQEKALQETSLQYADNVEQQKSAETDQDKATFEKNCQSAHLNIKMLTSYDEVLVTEERSDGIKTERVLSDKEKKEKLALSKKHVDLYCEK